MLFALNDLIVQEGGQTQYGPHETKAGGRRRKSRKSKGSRRRRRRTRRH